MPENRKNDAQYIGNKVKVRVTKKTARGRKVRVSDLSPSAMANRPIQPIDITPVDYQPPKPVEKDLQSIRDEGYREGRKLASDGGKTGGGPEKPAAAQSSEPKKVKARVAGQKQDVPAEPEKTVKQDKPAAAPAAQETKQKDEKPEEKAPAATETKEKDSKPEKASSASKKERKDKKSGKAPAAPEKGRKDKKSEKAAAAPEEEQKDESSGEAAAEPPKEAKEKDGGKSAQFGFDVASDGEGGKKKESGSIDPEPFEAEAAAGARCAAAGAKVRTRPTVPRTVVMLLSGLLMLYSLSPLAVGVFTLGIIPPLCIGAFFFAVAFFWPKICACRKPWFNALFLLSGVVVLAGITVIFYLFGQMYAASAVKPPSNRSDYTVVVLGCKTIGNRPSLMLEDRLDAAAEFLKAHPGAYCIVSGGQGEDELAPEAVIMKKYLVSKGISELRIVEEKRSSNTEENIAYSCAMLDDCNLYTDIVVVTDRFHQYRARHYLTQRGLRCYAVNSETRWFLVMHYWFKEMVAVAMLEMGMKIR